MRLKVEFKKKKKQSERDSIVKRDFSVLHEKDVAADFCSNVIKSIGLGCGLEKALAAAHKILPRRKKKGKGWFAEAEDVLRPLVDARNTNFNQYWHCKSVTAKERLWESRKELKEAVVAAKNAWIGARCGVVNGGGAVGGGLSEVEAWKAIVDMRDGLGKSRRVFVAKLKKQDGSVCTTAEEAAEARKVHFVQLFGKEPKYDPTVTDYIYQLPVREETGVTPTEEDVVKAVRALKCTGPGLEGVHAAAVKVIMSNDTLRGIVVKAVIEFWESGVVPSTWESCLLKILPRPGDQSLASKCRGIMLLEVVYKVVGNILKERIMVVSEGLEMSSSVGSGHLEVAWMQYST